MKSPTNGGGLWFLFAHGAGASSASPWMKRYADLLAQIAPVLPFDYDYMVCGRKRPDPLNKLIESHKRALDAGRVKFGPRAVLVGKSMGGRVGCHLALQEEVAGLVCLGYPLKGRQKNSPLRDQVLLDGKVPTLFVQGTRDSLCPLELLGDVLKKRRAHSELYVVASGDHSLEPTKTHLKQHGFSPDDIRAQILERIRAFVGGLARLVPDD